MNPGSSQVEVVWRDMTVESADGQSEQSVIVNRVHGKIAPYTMVALIGPSGAGKTTMLNSITGKSREGLRVSGELLLNGNFVDPRVWEHAVGFVGEHLYEYETQTVKETLSFATTMMRGGTCDEIDAGVYELAQTLGLIKTLDTRIGLISTGEKARLSLGIALIKRPAILIIDEIMNDLDQSTAVHILEILHEIKQQGKGIMIAFQKVPCDVLEFFDSIMMICQGEIVFSGGVNECLRFFASRGYRPGELQNVSEFLGSVLTVNVSDVVSEESEQQRIEAMKRCWKQVEPPVVSSIIAQIDCPVVFDRTLQKFMMIFRRNILDFFRKTEFLKIVGVQKMTTLVMLVFVYFRLDYTQNGIRDRFGILSFIVINCFEKTVTVSIMVFEAHRKVIKREICTGMYGTTVSYFAMLVSSFTTSGLSNLAYTAVVYWMVGLNPRFDRFVFFLVILIAALVFSISFAMLVALNTKTHVQAQILGSTIITSFVIFGGTFVNPDTIPGFIRWAIWLSPIYYAFEAMLQNQFKGMLFECDLSGRECMPDGDQALQFYGFKRIGTGLSTGILFLSTAVCVLLGVASMRTVIKPRIGEKDFENRSEMAGRI
ncbi:ABC-2 type transporter [Ordospora pajunii]|uniref:ABC-2 type transporter n=1 Tax=Ordospora pajunii TaxID=3039483 RepID=UPI0029527C59|nr:ABC-2 type transporter [Ordospora pajunii]KAH9411163.1 ABC-2 type transporter [Ordospora pajunii]